MTPIQFRSLLNAMHRLDLGGKAPRMSESLGSFLRQYERHKRDILEMAVSASVDVTRRGEIRGQSLGPITVFPLTDIAAPVWSSTNFGALQNVIVACPELMTTIDLRLWDSMAGRACINFFERGGSALRLSGGFRWLPPDRILPGTAELAPGPEADTSPWEDAAFMSYTGDDITRDPHPLEFRPMAIENQLLLGALRVVSGLVNGEDLEAPCATRVSRTRFSVRKGTVTTSRARTVMLSDRLVKCLVLREPHEDSWTIWDAVEIDANESLRHLIQGARLADSLRPAGRRFQDTHLTANALESLEQIGVSPDEPEPLPELPWGYDGVPPDFVRAVSARLRLTHVA